MVTQTIRVNLNQKDLETILAVQSDTLREIAFEFYATDAEEAVQLDPDEFTVKFNMLKPDNNFVMTTFTDGIIKLSDQMTAATGTGYYCILLMQDDEVIYSGNGKIIINDHVIGTENIDSVSEADGYTFPDDFYTKDTPLAVLDDSTTGTDSTWSSSKIAEEISSIPGADIIDDEVTSTEKTWSSSKISEEVAAAAASEIDDTTTATDSTWSSDKISEEIEAVTPTITKEVTGNPIEFEDGADAPLVKCVTQITGSQDLHGYDKPWVGGAGKNKFPLTITDGTQSGVTISKTDDGKVMLNGTATALIDFRFVDFALAAGTYILSQGSATGVTLFVYNGGSYYQNTTFTVDESSTGCGAFIRVPNGTVCNNLIIEPMIRPSGTTADFQPYSNICPITAYTEGEILVGDDTGLKTSDFGAQGTGITRTVESDGILFSADGGEGYQSIGIGQAYGLILGVGTYKLEIDIVSVSNPNTSCRLGLRKASYAFAQPSIDVTTVGHKSFFVTSDESTYVSMTLNGGTGVANAIKIANFKCIKVEQQSTTTYPSAIYRGSEDAVNGEVECIEKIITISSVTLYGPYGDDNANLYYADITDVVCAYAVDGMTYKPICDRYNAITSNATTGMKSGEFRTQGGAGTLYANRFYFRDDRYTDATDFNADLANNPIVVVARLYTPTTSSVTPTNLPIKSLSGYNHIESSTGALDIEYIVDDYQPIIDCIPAGPIYSTNEQITGTWTDGRPVYTRIIPVNATWQNIGTTSRQSFVYLQDWAKQIDLITELFIIGKDQYYGYTFNAAANLDRGNGTIEACWNDPFGGTYTSVPVECVRMSYVKTASVSRNLQRISDVNEVKELQDPLLEERREEEYEDDVHDQEMLEPGTVDTYRE